MLDDLDREQSSIGHAADAMLLGFGFSLQGPHVRIRVDPKVVKRLKDQLRVLTRRSRSLSMEYRIDQVNQFTAGWMAYFGLADTVTASPCRDLSEPSRRPAGQFAQVRNGR